MSQTIEQPLSSPPKKDAAILRATGIRKSFKTGDSEVQILKGTDFVVRPGEFVAIEGRSGSGKSTLLHILGALESVDAGKVEFEEMDYTTRSPMAQRWWRPRSWSPGNRMRALVIVIVLSTLGAVGGGFTREMYPAGRIVFLCCLPAAILGVLALIGSAVLLERRERPRADLRNRQFGFVFQFYHLLPELNVLQNTLIAPMVEYSWIGFRARRGRLRKRAIEILEQLGMGHRLKHRPNHLSGGERQRVAIARALMNSPRVLFADEPTGNLDLETGLQIMGVLEKLHREHGQTIVMVTHDRSLARQADRVLVLREGKLEKAE
jgi:ABC-type lipoprotein export system ATPase subunit